jgi:hypothetical protein
MSISKKFLIGTLARATGIVINMTHSQDAPAADQPDQQTTASTDISEKRSGIDAWGGGDGKPVNCLPRFKGEFKDRPRAHCGYRGRVHIKDDIPGDATDAVREQIRDYGIEPSSFS